MSRNLREFCPHLREIRSLGVYLDYTIDRYSWGDGIAHLVDACLPGNLTHAALNVAIINNKLTEALLQHQHGLETLEVTIRDGSYLECFTSLSTILKRCIRLRSLSVYNHSVSSCTI